MRAKLETFIENMDNDLNYRDTVLRVLNTPSTPKRHRNYLMLEAYMKSKELLSDNVDINVTPENKVTLRVLEAIIDKTERTIQ